MTTSREKKGHRGVRCGEWALMRRQMARGDTYRLRECGDGQRERRRFEREKPVVRIVWCMPERVVVWRESLRVRVMRIGEGVTSLERGEWNGAGVVSVAFAK